MQKWRGGGSSRLAKGEKRTQIEFIPNLVGLGWQCSFLNFEMMFSCASRIDPHPKAPANEKVLGLASSSWIRYGNQRWRNAWLGKGGYVRPQNVGKTWTTQITRSGVTTCYLTSRRYSGSTPKIVRHTEGWWFQLFARTHTSASGIMSFATIPTTKQTKCVKTLLMTDLVPTIQQFLKSTHNKHYIIVSHYQHPTLPICPVFQPIDPFFAEVSHSSSRAAACFLSSKRSLSPESREVTAWPGRISVGGNGASDGRFQGRFQGT